MEAPLRRERFTILRGAAWCCKMLQTPKREGASLVQPTTASHHLISFETQQTMAALPGRIQNDIGNHVRLRVYIRERAVCLQGTGRMVKGRSLGADSDSEGVQT
jgi:hypothetical protein